MVGPKTKKSNVFLINQLSNNVDKLKLKINTPIYIQVVYTYNLLLFGGINVKNVGGLKKGYINSVLIIKLDISL